MQQKLPVKKSLITPRLSQLQENDNPADIARQLLDTVVATPINVNNWPAIYPPTPRSTVYLAHNGISIFALYLVAPNEIRCTVTEDLGPVADDNCVEIFLRKPGCPRYWNFEFNFAGIVNASNRVTRPQATRLDEKQRSEIGRYVLDPKAADFAEYDTADYSLMLLVTIPLSLMDIDLHDTTTLLEGNLYSLSEKSNAPYYLSWSPIVEPTQGFHRPEHFGFIILQ